jgi:hypothetical protein
VSESHCLVRSASNRSGVLASLERFAQYKIRGCVGIIDADCDFVLQRARPRLDVCLTDKTDKETTSIESPAFEQFCAALGAKVDAGKLRCDLFEAAFPLGAIRRVSVRQGFVLDFRSVKVSDFIDDGLTCAVLRCCEVVASVNQDLTLPVQTLVDFTRDAACLSLPKAHVVRGHDLIAILECRSQAIFGRAVSQRELDYTLGEAYNENLFRLTRTYADLRAWESTAVPAYRLFA